MDWPHDPDSDDGSEGGRKYGLAIIAKKVEDDDFPLDLEDFAAEVGDHPVRINADRVVAAREIFEHVDVEEAENKLEFNQAIGRAMRAGDFWDYVPGEKASA